MMVLFIPEYNIQLQVSISNNNLYIVLEQVIGTLIQIHQSMIGVSDGKYVNYKLIYYSKLQ